MFKYILKRLLLMIPTFMGATFMVFGILNLVPGGPLERAIMQMEAQAGEGGAAGGSQLMEKNKLSPQIIDELRRQYGLDKPFLARYFVWLGLYPREFKTKTLEYGKGFRENLEYQMKDQKKYAIQRWVKAEQQGDKIVISKSGIGSDYKFTGEYQELPSESAITDWYPAEEWEVADMLDKIKLSDTTANLSKTVDVGKQFKEHVFRKSTESVNGSVQEVWVKIIKENGQLKVYESPFQYKAIDKDDKRTYDISMANGKVVTTDKQENLPDFISAWQPSTNWTSELEGKTVRISRYGFSGIFTGDFGRSYVYDEPVLKLIGDRIHISAYFGIISFLLTYLVCIPLGIFKAVKHNTRFDFISSALIFAGYATPGYALAVLLLMLFGGGSFLDIFPLGGFRSTNFEELTFMGKVWDQIHHTFLPVVCYMVGAFASLTILMKNSLMDNLNQDYVRTAFAKGLDEKVVVFKHAVRNSLIPIATGLGRVIGIFLAGSYLIELVFNIDGIGLLSFKSIINVDYPVFLGFLVISVTILLIGNLLSDLLYVLIDPRIKFD